MANGEYIEVLSSSARKDIQDITKDVDKFIAGINKANTSIKGLKVPSEFKNSISQLNNVMKQSNALLRAQAVQQERLAQVTNQSTQATKNNTGATLENARAETERVRTQREQLKLSEDQRRASERQERSTRLLGSAYIQLSRQQAEAARKVQDLIAKGRTAEQTQRQYNTELRNAQREFQALNQKVLLADRAVGRFNRNVGNYPQRAAAGLKDLIGAFGVVGGVTAFAAITRDIFNTTRELQSLDLALRQVVGTQQGFVESQAFLQRVSESYGIEIQGLTRSYTGFLAASQNAISAGEITANQINEIFESVSKASGAMGLSVEQQQGAFLALQQMISKGNVQAEEIRGQLAERLPGAFGILAKSMGVTEIQLNKLLKDGKVLAAEVLPAFAKQLEIAYGVENLDRVESLAASTTRLSNEWTNLIRVISDGEGVIAKFFSGAVDGISGALKGIKLLAQTEDERRTDMLKGLEESAYKTELEELNRLKDAKDDLLETEIKINSGREAQSNLEALRNERNLIYQNLEGLKAKLEAEDNIAGFDAFSRTSWAIDEQNKKLAANEDRVELIMGRWRAVNEFLKKPDPTSKVDTGKAKRQKADIDYLKEVYELRKQNTENEISDQERLMNDEDKHYTTRLEAAENYYFQKEKLLEIEHQEQMRLNDLNLKNQKEQYSTAISEGKATYTNLDELEYQHILRKEKINADFEHKKSENAIENAKKLKGVLDAIEDQKKVNIVDEAQLANIRQLNMELANVTTGTSYEKFKELEDRKTKIIEDATEERIRIELRRAQEEIKTVEEGSATYEALYNKILGKEKELEDAQTERLEKTKELTLDLKRATDEYLSSISSGFLGDAGLSSLEKFLVKGEDGLTQFEKLFQGAGDNMVKQFSVAFNAITEVSQEAMAFITQNSQARFDAMYAELDQQQKVAEGFAHTEEAKAEIQKQYDEKRREIKRREAKADKEMRIFNAIINTAQAVTAALPNIALSIIVGALGAAQIAMIASQPIPAFAEGGVTDKSGTILVNDAKGSKYQERVTTPEGKSFIPKGRNVLLSVPKGTVIDKAGTFDKDLNNILSDNAINRFPPQSLREAAGNITVNGGGLTKEDAVWAFSTALNNLSIVNNTIDENGFSSHVIRNGAKTTKLNAVKTNKGLSI